MFLNIVYSRPNKVLFVQTVNRVKSVLIQSKISRSDVCERLYKLIQSAAIGSVVYIILKPVRLLELRLPRNPHNQDRLSRVELPAKCF
jgi:hypothetical protein